MEYYYTTEELVEKLNEKEAKQNGKIRKYR